MESWFPAVESKNFGQLTVTLDGDNLLEDLEQLGFSDCHFHEEQWICNIDAAFEDVYAEDYYWEYYEDWFYDMESWFPDIDRENLFPKNGVDTALKDLYGEDYNWVWYDDIETENLYQGNDIIPSVNSNLEKSAFTHDSAMDWSLSSLLPNYSNRISIRYQENNLGPTANSSFPPFPEPLLTIGLLFLICFCFPLFLWLCYRCSLRAKRQRTELSQALLNSLDAENPRSD